MEKYDSKCYFRVKLFGLQRELEHAKYMLEQPIRWLQKHWWGLVVAYFLILCSLYVLIWTVIEPLGIPDRFTQIPDIVSRRIFLHLILSVILASHITLALELFIRKGNKNLFRSENSALVGVWKGEYQNHKGKRREAALNVFYDNQKLLAVITILTEQGSVSQKATIKDVENKILFTLHTDEITTEPSRTVRWRPEIWQCELLYDSENYQQIKAKVLDLDSNNTKREVSEFSLFKVRLET